MASTPLAPSKLPSWVSRAPAFLPAAGCVSPSLPSGVKASRSLTPKCSWAALSFLGFLEALLFSLLASPRPALALVSLSHEGMPIL